MQKHIDRHSDIIISIFRLILEQYPLNTETGEPVSVREIKGILEKARIAADQFSFLRIDEDAFVPLTVC